MKTYQKRQNWWKRLGSGMLAVAALLSLCPESTHAASRRGVVKLLHDPVENAWSWDADDIMRAYTEGITPGPIEVYYQDFDEVVEGDTHSVFAAWSEGGIVKLVYLEAFSGKLRNPYSNDGYEMDQPLVTILKGSGDPQIGGMLHVPMEHHTSQLLSGLLIGLDSRLCLVPYNWGGQVHTLVRTFTTGDTSLTGLAGTLANKLGLKGFIDDTLALSWTISGVDGEGIETMSEYLSDEVFLGFNQVFRDSDGRTTELLPDGLDLNLDTSTPRKLLQSFGESLVELGDNLNEGPLPSPIRVFVDERDPEYFFLTVDGVLYRFHWSLQRVARRRVGMPGTRVSMTYGRGPDSVLAGARSSEDKNQFVEFESYHKYVKGQAVGAGATEVMRPLYLRPSKKVEGQTSGLRFGFSGGFVVCEEAGLPTSRLKVGDNRTLGLREEWKGRDVQAGTFYSASAEVAGKMIAQYQVLSAYSGQLFKVVVNQNLSDESRKLNLQHFPTLSLPGADRFPDHPVTFLREREESQGIAVVGWRGTVYLVDFTGQPVPKIIAEYPLGTDPDSEIRFFPGAFDEDVNYSKDVNFFYASSGGKVFGLVAVWG